MKNQGSRGNAIFPAPENVPVFFKRIYHIASWICYPVTVVRARMNTKGKGFDFDFGFQREEGKKFLREREREREREKLS